MKIDMGWTKEVPDLVKRNKDFYYFGFRDPFFVMDKTDDTSPDVSLDEGLSQKQLDGIVMVIIDMLWNRVSEVKVLVIADDKVQKRIKNVFFSYYSHLDRKMMETGRGSFEERIIYCLPEVERMVFLGTKNYELVVLDRIEQYEREDYNKTEIVRNLNAAFVFATMHERHLKTDDIEANDIHRAVRDENTNGNKVANSARIANDMLEKSVYADISARPLLNIMSNRIVTLFLEKVIQKDNTLLLAKQSGEQLKEKSNLDIICLIL